MNLARRAAWWLAPPLVCLLVHLPGLMSWFRADDFAWLGVGLNRHGLQEYLSAIFSPMAQGTIRPWSERLFFMAGFHWFGLNPLPFRLMVFATQCANLALVAFIGARLTGRRAAGLAAALLWAVNDTLVEPLGWTSAYNQVLCGFFLLLSFHFLLRYLDTGERRFYFYQWIVFLLGFGANEVNVVYPALAAAYVFLFARRRLANVWPMLVPSILYTMLHFTVAKQHDPNYALHFTGAMLRTLGKYWCWTVGPFQFWTPGGVPALWIVIGLVVAISVGLLMFARRRGAVAQFCLLWFVIAISPVLPLRDHVTEYYSMLPSIGLCWLGGWALVEGRRGPAVALGGLYLYLMLPRTIAASEWSYQVSRQVRSVVEGVARAHELHPSQTILLDGVDTQLFYNAIEDRPFRLIGVEQVYLTPGSERNIAAPDVADFMLPGAEAARTSLQIYDVRGQHLRNITSSYRWPANEALPRRVDVGSELASPLLGVEWYPPEGNHRWMPRRATVRMAGPSDAGRKLYLRGYYPEGQVSNGPLEVTVAVETLTLGRASIRSGGEFELAFPLPTELLGRPEMKLTVEVSRTFRTGTDIRDLGLAFGEFSVR